MKIAFTSSYLTTGHDLPQTEKNIVKEFKKRKAKVVVFDATKVSYLMDHAMDVYAGKHKITDADILMIRRARYAEKESFQLAKVMEKIGSTVIDGAEAFTYPIQKLHFDTQIFQYLYYPKTCFLNSVDEAKLAIKKMKFTFPLVIKPQASTRARGVIIAKSMAHLLHYPRKYQEHGIILQELIEPKYEYRVLIVGGKSLGAVRKTSNIFYRKHNENVFEYVRDRQVEQFTERAVKHLSGDIYGVDVLETQDGKFHILEANRNPSFVNFKRKSGINVEAKIVEFCLQKARQ